MITLHPVVLAHQKRKDGTWNVKIRVTFKGRHRYLPTTLSVTSDQLTRSSMKIKDAMITSKVNDVMYDIRRALTNIPTLALMDRDVDYVMDQLRLQLTHPDNTFRLDFFEFADDYIQCKRGATRSTYVTALNSFARFLGGSYIDINDITKTMLQQYRKWVDEEPRMNWDKFSKKPVATSKKKTVTAGSGYLRRLAHIYEAAKDIYNDEEMGTVLIPKSPFSKIPKPTAPPNGQRNLGVEVIQMMIDDKPVRKTMRISLAAFIVSFGTMGANLVDLYNAPNFEGKVWKYQRQKVASRRADHAQVECEIDPRLKPFIEKLKDGPNYKWLPLLGQMGKDHRVAAHNINRNLKNWAKAHGVEEFTFYAARHSFATLGRSVCNIEKATIDECLAHVGDYALTDIYAERDWKRINKAGHKVLDLFTWPK